MGTELTVAFLLQHWLRERPTLFCYRHIAHLIVLILWPCGRSCRPISITSTSTVEITELPVGQHERYFPLVLGTKCNCCSKIYVIPRTAWAVLLSSSYCLYPNVVCHIFVVSAFRDHSLLHCCFAPSWLVPMNRDEAAWLASRLSPPSCYCEDHSQLSQALPLIKWG